MDPRPRVVLGQESGNALTRMALFALFCCFFAGWLWYYSSSEISVPSQRIPLEKGLSADELRLVNSYLQQQGQLCILHCGLWRYKRRVRICVHESCFPLPTALTTTFFHGNSVTWTIDTAWTIQSPTLVATYTLNCHLMIIMWSINCWNYIYSKGPGNWAGQNGTPCSLSVHVSLILNIAEL